METNSRPTQAQKVYDYMVKHESIDFMKSWNELGISRLSARISELENNKDVAINREWKKFKAKDGTTVKYVAYSIGV